MSAQRPSRLGGEPDDRPTYEALQSRLAAAEDAVEAIRRGEIDALVVPTEDGERLFTLDGADAFYRLLLEALPLGIAGLDRGGTILFANPQLVQMLGVPEERILGAAIGDFLPPDKAAAGTLALARATDGTLPEVTELIDAAGAGIPVTVMLRMLPGEADAASCLIVGDLSERRRELAGERMRYEQVIETTSEGVWTTDQHETITFANQAMGHLLGYDPAEMIGRPALDFVAAASLPQARRSRDPHLRALGDQGELRMKTRDEAELWVLMSSNPLRDADGRHIGTLSMATNSTANRQIAIYKATMAALTESHARAVAASEAKSTFLATMSHEIRTPLNGVLGMLRLLEATRLTVEQHEYVGHAEASGAALLGVIGDVLDFSKVEAGLLQVASERFDLGGLARDLCTLLLPSAQAHGIELRCELPAVPRIAVGDASRTRQVVTNLIANAIKFTPEGEVVVRIGGEGPAAGLEVVDTGIGIAPETVEVLFEPFTQADVSTTRTYAGTGLGLAISKRLVGLMGGEIGVDSALGQGSRFWFTLPSSASGPAASESAAAPAPAGRFAGDGQMVLIVEDNPVNQLVARRLLELSGLRVHVAPNGRIAVEMSRRDAFSLILMDCQMPELDGYEATAEIRRDEASGAHVPIVAMTAHALEGDRKRCLDAGMTTTSASR